jgi:hypothetical protein
MSSADRATAIGRFEPSAGHKRNAAKLADRYFSEQQKANGVDERRGGAERKARQKLADLTAEQYREIIFVGLEKKALIQQRMEARIALGHLVDMARRGR